jgi:hypothetical protein
MGVFYHNYPTLSTMASINIDKPTIVNVTNQGRLLPFHSPLLQELLLLSFPLATKMFQFVRLSLTCPWIQQQFESFTYSGISGSMLIFNSPKHFVAYYALPRQNFSHYITLTQAQMCLQPLPPEIQNLKMSKRHKHSESER